MDVRCDLQNFFSYRYWNILPVRCKFYRMNMDFVFNYIYVETRKTITYFRSWF